MKVLFVTVPAHGHLDPMLPVTNAVVEAGAEALFATTTAFADAIVARGFQARGLGEPADEVTFSGVLDPGSVERARRAGSALGTWVVDPLLDLVRDWAPDVLVHDHLSTVGAVVSALADVPNAFSSVGVMRGEQMMSGWLARLAALWSERGLPGSPAEAMYRYLYLDRCPPSLQRPDISVVDTAHLVRPVYLDTGDAPAQAEFNFPADQPTVYVTLGTLFNAPAIFSTLLDVLADEPVNVIMTVGAENDTASLRRPLENVRVERYVPQSAVLPQCDLVICHGGSGTVFGALSEGLPMLLMPQGADQFDNAERCVTRGVAKLVPPDLAAASVRTHVRELLEVESYRRNAGEVRLEIEAMPVPDRAAALLKRLADTGQPVTRESR